MGGPWDQSLFPLSSKTIFFLEDRIFIPRIPLSEWWFNLQVKDSGDMFPPLPVHATPLEMAQLDNGADS